MSDLVVENLAVNYGSVRAVWDVSLRVSPGQVVTILGRNGAGKTTTLSAIAGILAARSGLILFGDENITRAKPHDRVRKGISLVQEGKRIFRKLKVEENLLIGTYALRGPRRVATDQIDEIYERFPILGERRKQLAGALSGGQQQILAIAQALVARPAVLLLDEPSAGLAPSIAADVLHIVSELRQEGLAIILVEQLIEDAIDIADEVIVLDVGRVLARESWPRTKCSEFLVRTTNERSN